MVPTSRGNETPGYNVGVGVANITYAEVEQIVSPLVAVIRDLKQSIEAHRTAVEQLAARVDEIVPSAAAIDPALTQTYALLQSGLGLVRQNGNGAQTQATAQSAQVPPATQSTQVSRTSQSSSGR